MEFGSPTSSFGRMMFYDSKVLLRVLGEDLLSIAPAEEPGGPIRVNAKLFDGDRLALEIEDNVLSIAQDNWDVEIEGPVLTIRRGVREPSLVYRFLPRSGVRVEKISMDYKGLALTVTGERVQLGRQGFEISSIGAHFQSCDTCISVDNTGVTLGHDPRPHASRAPFTFQHCTLSNGLHVLGIDHARLLNCRIDRGIRIENGGRLDLTAGVIFGVPPST
jgi:hypothetical protein